MANTAKLFEKFTEFLVETLEAGGTVHHIADDGEKVLQPLDGSFLSVVRAFLKDFPPDEASLGSTTINEALSRYKGLPFDSKKKGNAATAS